MQMKFYSPLTADFFPNEPDYEDEFYDEYEGYRQDGHELLEFSREEYLRSLISGKEILPRPCTHHAELVRQISGLCNNANQLAHRANSTGIAGQDSVDEMTLLARQIWNEINEKW